MLKVPMLKVPMLKVPMLKVPMDIGGHRGTSGDIGVHLETGETPTALATDSTDYTDVTATATTTATALATDSTDYTDVTATATTTATTLATDGTACPERAERVEGITRM